MKSAKLTTESGYTWGTSINPDCSNKDINPEEERKMELIKQLLEHREPGRLPAWSKSPNNVHCLKGTPVYESSNINYTLELNPEIVVTDKTIDIVKVPLFEEPFILASFGSVKDFLKWWVQNRRVVCVECTMSKHQSEMATIGGNDVCHDCVDQGE